jgi:tetratricopeptide (TPR) repeat protein
MDEIALPNSEPGAHPAQHIRALYRLGNAEHLEALFALWRNEDPTLQIARALLIAKEDQNRYVIRSLHQLQGDWHAKQREWSKSRNAYHEAVRLARERNLMDALSETGLALAKYHLDELSDAHEEAQRLAQLREPAHYELARLWQAIGNLAQARHHAREAYKEYWGDGEPYVFRYWLDRTTELLHELGEPIPQLPPFDPAKVQPYPWEAEVQAAIDRLNAEKAAAAAADQDTKPHPTIE